MRFLITLSSSTLLSLTMGSTAYAETQVLQGYIQESLMQEPVPAPLRAQSILNESSLKKLTPENVWCQIPAWFAGVWRSSLDTNSGKRYLPQYSPQGTLSWIEQKKDPNSSRLLALGGEVATSTVTYGTLTDKNGSVWHYLEKPYSYPAHGDKTHWWYRRIIDRRLFVSGANEVITQSAGTDTQLYKETNVIMHTVQSLTHNTIRPLREDLVEVTTRTKSYDEKGHAVGGSEVRYLSQRIKDFSPAQDARLRELFKQFLLSQHKPELVPE